MSQLSARFSALRRFFPDLFGYSRKSFMGDIGAGLTVGIVALPLSLALAVATGVPPVFGLYTAAIAGFLAALFAGSPFSVSGPAAAMVPILAAIIHEHGLSQLPYITLLAALFLGMFALFGLGRHINKVPESVILGFSAGVAVVIFCSQLNSFLGLQGIAHQESFAGKVTETLTHLGAVSWPTFLLGLLTITILIGWPKLPKVGKFPATLVAVLVATLIVLTVPALASTSTLGSVFGQLPLGLPQLLPHFDFNNLLQPNLWLPALELAGLVAIESLLCAVVADRLTKKTHRPNQELFAQGIGNAAVAFFGSLPSTAVIARTGTIVKSGAQSRVASVLHALVVVVFLVALAPLAAFIPLTALSAVLLVTAIRIGEFGVIKTFVREKSWRLSTVLAITLLLTVFTDLVIGVGGGLLLHFMLEFHHKFSGKRDQDGPIILAEEEA